MFTILFQVLHDNDDISGSMNLNNVIRIVHKYYTHTALYFIIF